MTKFCSRTSYREPLACRRSPTRGVLELERERELLHARNEHGCLFARKLPPAPGCDLRCFAASGFSTFQCPGQPAAAGPLQGMSIAK